MSKIVKKNILDLGHNQIYELIEENMQAIIENFNDLGTDPKFKRGLTIKLTFKGDEERTQIHMESSVVSKLAPIEARGVALMNVREVDRSTGEVFHVLKEVTSQIPGQINLDGHITEQEVVIIGKYADDVIARAQRAHNAITQDKSEHIEIEENNRGGF